MRCKQLIQEDGDILGFHLVEIGLCDYLTEGLIIQEEQADVSRKEQRHGSNLFLVALFLSFEFDFIDELEEVL